MKLFFRVVSGLVFFALGLSALAQGVAFGNGFMGASGSSGNEALRAEAASAPWRSDRVLAPSAIAPRETVSVAPSRELSEPAPAPVVRTAASSSAPPNQFQRFVQEATGRLLPQYGSELFKGPQPFAVDAALPAPADHVLAVGDEVRVQVWGAVDYLSLIHISEPTRH